MIGRAIDSLIGLFRPDWALYRAQMRSVLEQVQSVGGGGNAGYSAGKLNRLTKGSNHGSLNENAIPRAEVGRLRALSWDLYRNNSQAKKIVRTLESKVIGRGLRPQSQANKQDGQPHVDFRTRAHQLWRAVHETLDYRGRPGSGGQDFTELAKTALRATILGGEVLYRFRSFEKKTPDKLPDLKLQLIHADRLFDAGDVVAPGGNTIFHGIELNDTDRRVAYHIHRYHPSDPRGAAARQDVVRVPAAFMGHLYVAEDVDQLRGTPWFSAALLKMRDTNDYEYNELKAAAVAACVVLGYRRSNGQSQFGVDQPDNWDLTDADGNKLSAIQPGMLLDLGKTGEIQGFNPQRPNANASEFIAHMLRSQATAVPGVKGTTLTGDYRNSSFSSERSADNDIWPEIEGLQDWFSGCFCQPIYEQVITAGVVSGYFEGILDAGEFSERKADYLRAGWQGPVARSINPVDDAEASKKRVQNGQSTPQLECGLVGRNWQENLQQIAEYIEFAKGLGIPEDIIAQTLGIEQKDEPQGSDDGDKSKKGAASNEAA